MNYLNTLIGPKLNCVPGEFHNQFVKEIIRLSCDNLVHIPIIKKDIMERLSGRYALAYVTGASENNPSFFHNLMVSEGISKEAMESNQYEAWVVENLLRIRELDISAYENVLDNITLDAENVLNFYKICHKAPSFTILPVGSALEWLPFNKELQFHELVNPPLLSVW